MSKHMIWTNFELPEIGPMEREEYPGVSDDELPYIVNDDWLEDERDNLDVDVGGTIVVFGRIERWNGAVYGYKVLDGTRLSDVIYFFRDDDNMEWYVEDGELKGRGAHHDGTNTYTYRVMKDQELAARLAYEFIDYNEVLRNTEPLGDMVSKIYGWEEQE